MVPVDLQHTHVLMRIGQATLIGRSCTAPVDISPYEDILVKNRMILKLADTDCVPNGARGMSHMCDQSVARMSSDHVFMDHNSMQAKLKTVPSCLQIHDSLISIFQNRP